MTDQTAKALQLHASDNVVIALSDLVAGEQIPPNATTLLQPVPSGHKICIADIKQGERVLKYGQSIGQATADIKAGEHVHSHNLGMGEHQQDYGFSSEYVPLPAPDREYTFEGFQRANGKVGTRNYIGIITSVNCAGSVAKFIGEAVEREGLLDAFPNIDGIVPIVHGTGCGMSSKGEGFETLHRTLSGYAHNPNFGAILLIGLGCEVMQVSGLVNQPLFEDTTRYRYMNIQQVGGTRQAIEQGKAVIRELAEVVNQDKRSTTPASSLVIGMQCGGSDGYSGITANPALGAASDLVIRQGGTMLLSETSEVYGAEHLLTRRAVSPEVGQRLIDRIHWWEDYCARNGGEMDNNPSPGNKLGGLTTILEKSLGAAAKGGTAPMSDVIKYAEPLNASGLVFMDSPGYDPCSVTGQVATGANMIIFTTGRGSVSGFKPSPCIKMASNTDMYQRLIEDMDINCGDIIGGDVGIADKGEQIFQLILEIASGKETKSETLGFGSTEFVPWQIGAVM